MLRRIFFSLCLLLNLQVLAQEQDSEESDAYVQTFPEKFHLKLITQYAPMSLRMGNDNTDQQVIYKHNSRPLVGIGTIITGIHLIASVKLPESLSRSETAYGKPRFHDFQVNVNGKKVLVNFAYQFRDGFYLSDTRNLPVLSSEDPFLLPDLSTERYVLNFVYVFNADKFSYRAIVTQHDRQLKTAGSFFIVPGLKYLKMLGDESLLPPDYRPVFDSPARLYRGEFSGFAFMPGYTHTFTLGAFYLNMGLALGPELQYKEYRTGENTQYTWQVEPIMNLRGGLGYDNGKFFTGLYYLNRTDNYQAGDLNFRYQSNFIRLFVGHRFQQTDWMQSLRESALYQWAGGLF